MAIYIRDTGRSYPNPNQNGEFERSHKRPSSGDYDSYSYHTGGGTDYKITFENGGPGSLPFGRDAVYYIGAQEETCIDGCYYQRREVWRHYRGGRGGDKPFEVTSGNIDHMYTHDKNIKEWDVIGEKGVSYVVSQYQREFDNPVFYVGALPFTWNGNDSHRIWKYYNNSVNNTRFYVTSGSNTPNVDSGYENVQGDNDDIFGYVITSDSDAAAWNTYGEHAENGDVLLPLRHYRATNGGRTDDFYTTDPDEGDELSNDYSYQGVICWVWANYPKIGRKIVGDLGKIGPTGNCVDRSGWYNYNYYCSLGSVFNGRASYQWNGVDCVHGYDDYRRLEFPPSTVEGWGIDGEYRASFWQILTGGGSVWMQNYDEAIFEWRYGTNGAVKAALPRALEFEQMYDTQFVYYLYDTTYPWNGPIFGINYVLSDEGCCPNVACQDEFGNNRMCCVPNYTYHSHFYQIRQDSWETTSTELTLSDNDGGEGINESFWVADSFTERILFRYLDNVGQFVRGDTINGWYVSAVFYFADNLGAGYMELTNTSGNKGGAFTKDGVYTSDNGARARVLAGFGINDRAAFFGVYEFGKNISYFKVGLNPDALIPERNYKKATCEAVINDKGDVEEIVVTNGGRGYTKDEEVVIFMPEITNEYTQADLTQAVSSTGEGKEMQGAQSDPIHPEEYDLSDYENLELPLKTNEPMARKEYGQGYDDISEGFSAILGSTSGQKQFENPYGSSGKLRQATAEVSKIGSDGRIISVRVLDPGNGYTKNLPPEAVIVERNTGNQSGDASQNQIKNAVRENVEAPADLQRWKLPPEAESNWSGIPFKDQNPADMQDPGLDIITAGYSIDYVQTYLGYAEFEEGAQIKQCIPVPAKCFDFDIEGLLINAMPEPETFDLASQYADGLSDWNSQVYSAALNGIREVDNRISYTTSAYGWNDGRSCINMPQPKIYNARRFIDMPCPYFDLDPDTGEKKAYGYMTYKYCASERREAGFSVSLTCEGRARGSEGKEFMRFLSELPKPKLTDTRPVVNTAGNNKDCWPCYRGTEPTHWGVCFETDDGDIEFCPLGGDENTYDYDRVGFTELEQLQVWLGDNVAVGEAFHIFTWMAGTGEFGPPDPETGESEEIQEEQSENYPYTIITVDPCDNGVPPNECWDTYVRHNNNPDGVLDVYCGWDTDHNPIEGNTYCDTPELFNPCAALSAVANTAIAVDPSLIRKPAYRMVMGPYTGDMKVVNWSNLSNAVIADVVKNYGNPYFSECSINLDEISASPLNKAQEPF